MKTEEYPADWKKRSRTKIQAAQLRCSRCGAKHGRTKRRSKYTGNDYITYCQVHHPQHDPWNAESPAEEVLCTACHLKLHPRRKRVGTAAEAEQARLRRRARYGAVSIKELLAMARRLGIEFTHALQDDGLHLWTWKSAVSEGTSHDFADALEQSIFDMVMTYQARNCN